MCGGADGVIVQKLLPLVEGWRLADRFKKLAHPEDHSVDVITEWRLETREEWDRLFGQEVVLC